MRIIEMAQEEEDNVTNAGKMAILQENAPTKLQRTGKAKPILKEHLEAQASMITDPADIKKRVRREEAKKETEAHPARVQNHLAKAPKNDNNIVRKPSGEKAVISKGPSRAPAVLKKAVAAVRTTDGERKT